MRTFDRWNTAVRAQPSLGARVLCAASRACRGPADGCVVDLGHVNEAEAVPLDRQGNFFNLPSKFDGGPGGIGNAELATNTLWERAHPVEPWSMLVTLRFPSARDRLFHPSRMRIERAESKQNLKLVSLPQVCFVWACNTGKHYKIWANTGQN